MFTHKTPLLDTKKEQKRSTRFALCFFIAVVALALVGVSKFKWEESSFIEQSLALNLGEDGLTQGQRSALKYIKDEERRNVYYHSFRVGNEQALQNPPNTEEVPVGLDYDQVLFYHHIQGGKTATWGDFLPNYWVFMKIAETKRARQEDDIQLTWITDYDSELAPPANNAKFSTELTEKWVISAHDPSKPCSANGDDIEEIPKESLCEAAILVNQKKLVGTVFMHPKPITPNQEPYVAPDPNEQVQRGPEGCFFDRQNAPRTAEDWQDKNPKFGQGFMTFGERSMDQGVQDVRLCMKDENQGKARMYKRAKAFIDKLVSSINIHCNEPNSSTNIDAAECTAEEKNVWSSFGYDRNNHPAFNKQGRCDWFWITETYRWPQCGITVILRPNRAMRVDSTVSAGNPLFTINPNTDTAMRNAYFVAMDFGKVPSNPRVADLAICIDQDFRANEVFIARAGAIYEQWGQGPNEPFNEDGLIVDPPPGGGFNNNHRPADFPNVNMGVIQPGVASFIKYQDLVQQEVHKFIRKAKAKESRKKLICYLASVESEEPQVASQLNQILLTLQDRVQEGAPGAYDFAIIIGGIKEAETDDISSGIAGDRIHAVHEHIPYGMLAPFCDVWINQFGGGSLFWGIFHGVPPLLAPHPGQSAHDKDWAIRKLGETTICGNCVKLANHADWEFNEQLGKKWILDADLGVATYINLLKDAVNPDEQFKTNLNHLKFNLYRQWATLEELESVNGDPFLDDGRIMGHDSDSMVSLAEYILDKVHDKPNNYYRTIDLLEDDVLKMTFQAQLRQRIKAVVYTDPQPRETIDGACIYALRGDNCQPSRSRNYIPNNNQRFVLKRENVKATGCGKSKWGIKDRSRACDLCCPAEQQQNQQRMDTQNV